MTFLTGFASTLNPGEPISAIASVILHPHPYFDWLAATIPAVTATILAARLICDQWAQHDRHSVRSLAAVNVRR